MNVRETPAEQAFRADVRAWLEANKPDEPLPPGDTAEGFETNRAWERKVADAGWAALTWPQEYGGRGATLWEWMIFEEEYYGAGLPQSVSGNGIALLGPTLLEFGTEEQKLRILPRMARAEDMWCQGWSEPEAGSDLAGIRSRAERDEKRGGWRIYGQKTWATRGAYCSHLFGLFRTDPEAGRHRGLTYLMIDLRTEGVTVNPVAKLDGTPGFAEVFFDGAFVPDADVLGGVNQGWKVAMATAGSERALLRTPGRFMATADRLIDLHRRRRLEGAPETDELRDEVIDAWMGANAFHWFTAMTVSQLLAGQKLGAESSLSKVFWSELDVAMHETALKLLGSEADLKSDWMHGYEFSLSGPIYAGTNEIQRNTIAERVLGLPRA